MPQTSAIGAPGDGSGNQFPRMPSNKRNAAMEKISANCLRLRGRRTTALGGPNDAYGRDDSIEQLMIRLGVIPIYMWKTATAGTDFHAADPPVSFQPTTLAFTDGSTPASEAFNDGTTPTQHVYTTPSIKQVVTATTANSPNAKGRAAAII